MIATGQMHTVQDFCDAAFRANGIDLQWEGEGATTRALHDGRELVAVDPDLYRPSDIRESVGDATHAHESLGWNSSTTFESLVERLRPEENPTPASDGNRPPQKAMPSLIQILSSVWSHPANRECSSAFGLTGDLLAVLEASDGRPQRSTFTGSA